MERYPEIQLILDNPNVSTQRMADALGCNRTTVCRHLKRMKESGVLVREGSDKTGVWKISLPKN